ncbi:MAG: hypothetical protein HKM89_09770 [Gemmatimonadales bacterium]|nr:hypothetical protein [Gemmatimonadales bacterium]
MKFLCVDCNVQMNYEDRQVPGDGTFAAAYVCPACNRRIAMLANPMETQLVEALGVQVGGKTLEAQPMDLVRRTMEGKDDAFEDAPDRPPPGGGRSAPPRWTEEAEARLSRVPAFVRGMVKRIYAEYAAERGLPEITPEIMDRARTELGLEGM